MYMEFTEGKGSASPMEIKPISIEVIATSDTLGKLNTDFLKRIAVAGSDGILFNANDGSSDVSVNINLIPDDAGAWTKLTNESWGTFTALCQNGLSETYIRDTLYGCAEYDGDPRPGINESNMVIKLYDAGEAGVRRTLRGIAILKVGDENIDLLVLGTAAESRNCQTRGRLDIKKLNDGVVCGRGIHLLKFVSYIGAESTVTLFALATVISYYWKYGWRFGICSVEGELKYGGDEKAWEADIKRLYDELVHTQFDLGETDLIEYLKPFAGYASHGYATAQEAGCDRREALVQSEGEGFRMVLCPELNEYSPLYVRKGEAGSNRCYNKTLKRGLRKRTRGRPMKRRRTRMGRPMKRRRTRMGRRM